MVISTMPQNWLCRTENNAIPQIRRIRRRISTHTANTLARRIRFVGEPFSGTINIISSAYISRKISKSSNGILVHGIRMTADPDGIDFLDFLILCVGKF